VCAFSDTGVCVFMLANMQISVFFHLYTSTLLNSTLLLISLPVCCNLKESSSMSHVFVCFKGTSSPRWTAPMLASTAAS